MGRVTRHVFEDNCKAWSGDHCVDPLLVPGVLFSSRKVDADDPGLEDMARTALQLFGVSAKSGVDGRKAGIPFCVTLPPFYSPPLMFSACRSSRDPSTFKKVIVLGVDGMDPNFLERH